MTERELGPQLRLLERVDVAAENMFMPGGEIQEVLAEEYLEAGDDEGADEVLSGGRDVVAIGQDPFAPLES